MQALSVAGTLILAAIVYYIFALYTAYSKAKLIGLPIVTCPVNPLNPLWLIFSVPLRPVLSKYLPAFLWQRLEVATYGFEIFSRYEPFRRFGKCYALVGPGTFEVWLADAELINIVLSRRKAFEMADMASRFMSRFGPNSISSKGDDWARQRKIIAPAVNERISENVWFESISQTRAMMASFLPSLTANSGTTDLAIEGLRSIAINVLGAAGYGKPRNFGEHEPAPAGFQFSFMESIFTIIDNMITSTLVPSSILSLPFLPAGVRKLGAAVKEFPLHQSLAIEAERASTSNIGKHNLLSTLVKSSDQGRADSKLSNFLTEEELHGNLYLVTLAGFDTTANTMAYALAHLALHPSLQSWLYDEITALPSSTTSTSPTNTNTPDYKTTFPHLPRLLAFMFETLRLFPPVLHSQRQTMADEFIKLSTGQELHFPAGMDVYICMSIVHIDPSIWGEDALAFRPQRWITPDGTLAEPPAKGAFVPWSSGPRVCPGMKMAQVEFVAVFLTILKDFRVEAVVRAGESEEQARERLEEVVRDSQPKLTLQMRRPSEVVVRFVRR